MIIYHILLHACTTTNFLRYIERMYPVNPPLSITFLYLTLSLLSLPTSTKVADARFEEAGFKEQDKKYTEYLVTAHVAHLPP